MLDARFHTRSGDGPHALVQVDLCLLGTEYFACADGGEDRELKSSGGRTGLSAQLCYEGGYLSVRQCGVMLDLI